MDTKVLFGEVDFAVQEALENRVSILDSLELEEWTGEVLKKDAQDVYKVIQDTVEAKGWTVENYNRIVQRLVSNRHTPSHIRL